MTINILRGCKMCIAALLTQHIRSNLMYSAASIISIYQQAHLRSVPFSPGSGDIYVNFKLGQNRACCPQIPPTG